MNSGVKSFEKPASMNIESIHIPELKLDEINLINQSLTNISKINRKGNDKALKNNSLSNVSSLY